MRARGADVTDIVVLVVAANDGIMPQTREAIAHSKAAGKTIIVAINKCDLPAADPVKTKSGLMEEGLVPTDFGGDVECVEVSALTGAGIDDLLGLLVLQSEVLELQANPKANCRASIIEARVEPGTGSSATAIVESGTIRVGMPFICGPYAGKVRALVNDHGERVKKVGPGMPVEITGFSETPNVGDELVEMENERAAKKLGEERQEELRKQRLAQPRKARMEELLAMMGDGTQKAQLKILLKGGCAGFRGSHQESCSGHPVGQSGMRLPERLRRPHLGIGRSAGLLLGRRHPGLQRQGGSQRRQTAQAGRRAGKTVFHRLRTH